MQGEDVLAAMMVATTFLFFSMTMFCLYGESLESRD